MERPCFHREIVDFVGETLKNCRGSLHGKNKMRHYKVRMAARQPVGKAAAVVY